MREKSLPHVTLYGRDRDKKNCRNWDALRESNETWFHFKCWILNDRTHVGGPLRAHDVFIYLFLYSFSHAVALKEEKKSVSLVTRWKKNWNEEFFFPQVLFFGERAASARVAIVHGGGFKFIRTWRRPCRAGDCQRPDTRHRVGRLHLAVVPPTLYSRRSQRRWDPGSGLRNLSQFSRP